MSVRELATQELISELEIVFLGSRPTVSVVINKPKVVTSNSAHPSKSGRPGQNALFHVSLVVWLEQGTA